MVAFKTLLSIVLILASCSDGFGTTTAITDDGRAVLLNEDGTWQYAPQDTNPQSDTIVFDFRKTKWGMTKELVRRAETAKLEQENEIKAKYPELTQLCHLVNK